MNNDWNKATKTELFYKNVTCELCNENDDTRLFHNLDIVDETNHVIICEVCSKTMNKEWKACNCENYKDYDNK